MDPCSQWRWGGNFVPKILEDVYRGGVGGPVTSEAKAELEKQRIIMHFTETASVGKEGKGREDEVA